MSSVSRDRSWAPRRAAPALLWALAITLGSTSASAARAQVVRGEGRSAPVGTLGPDDACVIAPLRPRAVAICWADPAPPAPALSWSRRTLGSRRFEVASRSLEGPGLAVTVVGTAGTCVSQVRSLVLVRTVGRAPPMGLPERTVVGVEVPTDGACAAIGTAKIVLGGSHASASYVVARTVGTDARGAAAVRAMRAARMPSAAVSADDTYGPDGARAFEADAGSVRLTVVLAWDRRPPHDDPATDGTGTVLALRVGTGRVAETLGQLFSGELVVDGARVLALGVADYGERRAGGVPVVPRTWQREIRLLSARGDVLRAVAVLCPPSPGFFDRAACGVED